MRYFNNSPLLTKEAIQEVREYLEPLLLWCEKRDERGKLTSKEWRQRQREYDERMKNR